MKVRSLLFVTSLMVIISSCEKFSEESLNLKKDVMQIIFFSNEADYTQEASYYDALIELKQDFPTEIKNMLVLSPTQGKQYYNTFNVKSCPALLVIYNNEVMVRINGDTSTEKIIRPVSEVLGGNLNAVNE